MSETFVNKPRLILYSKNDLKLLIGLPSLTGSAGPILLKCKLKFICPSNRDYVLEQLGLLDPITIRLFWYALGGEINNPHIEPISAQYPVFIPDINNFDWEGLKTEYDILRI
jgi:hypothetical protein